MKRCVIKNCGKEAKYIVIDNDAPLIGFIPCCKRHLAIAVDCAFDFNEYNKQEKNFVEIKKIDRLTQQERDDYYIDEEIV